MEEKRWISSKALFSAISELLAENRQAAFTVTGMSMWPLLCHGRDQVILESIQPEGVKKGDIVLVRVTDSRYILHRVTKVSDDGIETTGDGNCYRDGMFSYSSVVARVRFLIRDGRKIECQKRKWRFLFSCWMLLYPIRRHIFRTWIKVRNYMR